MCTCVIGDSLFASSCSHAHMFINCTKNAEMNVSLGCLSLERIAHKCRTVANAGPHTRIKMFIYDVNSYPMPCVTILHSGLQRFRLFYASTDAYFTSGICNYVKKVATVRPLFVICLCSKGFANGGRAGCMYAYFIIYFDLFAQVLSSGEGIEAICRTLECICRLSGRIGALICSPLSN